MSAVSENRTKGATGGVTNEKQIGASGLTGGKQNGDKVMEEKQSRIKKPEIRDLGLDQGTVQGTGQNLLWSLMRNHGNAIAAKRYFLILMMNYLNVKDANPTIL